MGECYDFQSHLPECYDIYSHLPECYMFYSYLPDIDDEDDKYPDPEDPNNPVFGKPSQPPLMPEFEIPGFAEIYCIHSRGWHSFAVVGKYRPTPLDELRIVIAEVLFVQSEDGGVGEVVKFGFYTNIEEYGITDPSKIKQLFASSNERSTDDMILHYNGDIYIFGGMLLTFSKVLNNETAPNLRNRKECGVFYEGVLCDDITVIQYQYTPQCDGGASCINPNTHMQRLTGYDYNSFNYTRTNDPYYYGYWDGSSVDGYGTPLAERQYKSKIIDVYGGCITRNGYIIDVESSGTFSYCLSYPSCSYASQNTWAWRTPVSSPYSEYPKINNGGYNFNIGEGIAGNTSTKPIGQLSAYTTIIANLITKETSELSCSDFSIDGEVVMYVDGTKKVYQKTKDEIFPPDN